MSVSDDMIFLEIYCVCLHIRGKGRCLHETLSLSVYPSVVWNDTQLTTTIWIGGLSRLRLIGYYVLNYCFFSACHKMTFPSKLEGSLLIRKKQ